MNWGIKIMLVFSLFVAGMLFMVFKSAKQNMDLVVPDYYEQELKYQDVIDASQRTLQLQGRTECKMLNEEIIINFPAEMSGKELKGEVWLYCIADKTRDVKKDFKVNDGKMIFPVASYNKGSYEIKISWRADNRNYYHQQKIFLQ